MDIKGILDFRHRWFDRVISVLDIQEENNITLEEAVTNLQQDIFSMTKMPSQVKSQLCNAITACYMKGYHSNSNNPSRKVILHLKKYKGVTLDISFQYHNQDYFIIYISTQYGDKMFHNYLVYEEDTAADELISPLHVVSLIDDKDIQTGNVISKEGNDYVIDFQDAITLKIDSKTFTVKACYFNQQPKKNIPFIGESLEKFDTLIEQADNTLDSIKKSYHHHNIKAATKKGGFYIEESESIWLADLFGFNYHAVSDLIDRLLLSKRKGDTISIGAEAFEIIDIARIEGSLIVIRTTFRTDSSQLVFFFYKDGNTVTTQLALLIDVFPHEGETSNDYHKNNIVQSASRQGVIANSHVQIIDNNRDDRSYTVKEDIHIKYDCYELRFPDTITVRDDEEETEDTSNEADNENEENVQQEHSNEAGDSNIPSNATLSRLDLFSRS